MMDGFTKQKQFFIDVLDKTKKDKKKALMLYKELVFHRFNEVLTNANPIFSELISKKDFEKLIVKFIKNGAKTDLVWQIPNEFRAFIKKQKDIKKKFPYIDDLLWFEWIEVKLFMGNYKGFKFDSLDFKKSYKLSSSAKLKKLFYKVYKREFETKGEYPLLSYYDMNQQEVIYREISPFMYSFLKLISKVSVKEAIKIISKENNIKQKELKEILTEPLKELCSLGVLKKKD